jgi:hypothetical protein
MHNAFAGLPCQSGPIRPCKIFRHSHSGDLILSAIPRAGVYASSRFLFKTFFPRFFFKKILKNDPLMCAAMDSPYNKFLRGGNKNKVGIF